MLTCLPDCTGTQVAPTPCRSREIAGCLLAAIIEGDEGNKLTYETSALSLGNLMEWLRMRLGASSQGATPQQATVTPVLDLESRKTPVAGVNWTHDFLYRGDLRKSDPRNEPRDLGAYAFTAFYKKVRRSAEKDDSKVRLPRADFTLKHPQSNTHLLMRYSEPRVPVLYGRIPKMPADWKGDHPEEMLEPDCKDEAHCNWALYVLALFYPIHMDDQIDLPQAGDLYTSVREWWRAKIAQLGECSPSPLASARNGPFRPSSVSLASIA